jgi:translocation and assembly module TamB
MRRVLYLIPIFLSILLAVVIGALFFFLGTEPGTRWVVKQTASHAPGLQIGKIDGTLLGRLTLQQVEYKEEQTTLTIDQLSLEWRPVHLLSGNLQIKSLSINQLRAVLSSQTKSPTAGQASLPGVRIPFRVTVEKSVVDGITIVSDGKETALDRVLFSGRGSASEIRIDDLEIASRAYSLELKGRVDPRRPYPFDATVAWSAKLQDSKSLNLKGEAKIDGDIKQARIVHQLIEPIPVRSEGIIEFKQTAPVSQTQHRTSEAGTPTGFVIRSFRFLALGGEINMAGEASWSPQPVWEMTLTGSSLNPGTQWPDWDGAISFSIYTKGRIAEQGILASFELNRMTGSFRGNTITAASGLNLNGETVRIDRLSLRTGTASLLASGVLSPRWDLAWSLNAPDLSHLLPGAQGRFIGKGRLQGERKLPTGSADIEGSGLVWNDAGIDSIKLRFLIDPEDRVESYIVLTAQGLRKAGQTLDRIEVNSKGKRTNHRLKADLKSGKHRLTLQMEGSIEETGWEGKLLRTVMSEETFGRWSLEKPVPVSIKTDTAEISEGCWKHADSTVCAMGRWTKAIGWKTSGRAERIPLGLIKPWLPDNLSLSGIVNGSWEAVSDHGALVSKTRWTLAGGKIEYTTKDGDRMMIGYRSGFFQTTLENKKLRTETELNFTGQGYFQSDLTVSPFDIREDWEKSGLEGSVHAEFSQLGLIAAFAPAVEKTEGKIKLDLTIGGTPEKPHINGTAALNQGSARIPALGLEIKQLHLAASGRNGETITIEATARSGPGALTVEGTVLMDATKGWQTRLAIKGDRFQAADLPEVKLFASPDLTLTVQNRRIDLNGKILIAEANIKIKELPKGSSRVSDDAVIVRSGKNSEAAPWEINTKVTIQFGDKVKFNGFGLTGGILGQIMVVEGPDRTATGEGELHVSDGRYKAYGQNLEIAHGRLLFTGPVNDPGIDVQATKRIDMITVGIRVAGTLKRPEITLFSNPPMDQTNILSYLLLGHPASQTQIGGGGIMNEVQSGSAESFQKASMGVGQYLSPKFYVSYGISTFNSTSTFGVRYQVTREFALRATSGEQQTGIDLLFIKEFH